MAQGHETFYGTRTSPELADLEAARAKAWSDYQSLACKPGWEDSSKDGAAHAAWAQFQLDKAKGYR